ncbi:hypothetical protein ACLOJK_018872, partial [Asimina triloba]
MNLNCKCTERRRQRIPEWCGAIIGVSYHIQGYHSDGAASTLLIFNNEKGFFEKNIESICSVGRSTKKGQRQRGYIGEKGTTIRLAVNFFIPFQVILEL